MTENPPPERREPGAPPTGSQPAETPPPPPPPTGSQPAETPPPPPPTASGGGPAPSPPPSPSGAGYPPPSGYGPAGPPSQLSPQDERLWGMLSHLSALVFAVIALAFIGPLLVMLIQGPKSAFVRSQAVEALNFQITTYIAAFISFLLVFVVVGLVLLPIVGIAWLVLTIMASIAANRGEDYRYPFNLRLVK